MKKKINCIMRTNGLYGINMKIIKTAAYIEKMKDKEVKDVVIHIKEPKPLSDKDMEYGVITPEALEEAIGHITDTSLKNTIQHMHGRRFGSCGHLMGQCRCPSWNHSHKIKYILGYPCPDCQKNKSPK